MFRWLADVIARTVCCIADGCGVGTVLAAVQRVVDFSVGRADCGDAAAVVTATRWFPQPVTSGVTSLFLPMTVQHGHEYRVALMATDVSGNSAVFYSECIYV